MTKPKKITLKKFPKKPKASASLNSWENYDKKVASIKKENDVKNKVYQKDLKAWEKEKKDKQALINKHK